jgi:hypothetical protein
MRGSRRAQRGVALLGLLAVAVMVFAYVLTSRLNAASQFVGIDREHNAKVLAQAKQALIGWMAMNAAGTDVNPGRLPCPEAPGYFGNPAQEGIAAGSCTLPAVGRLPWRTLGLEKLVDSEGEPLWYTVSTGWALPCASPPTSLTCKTNINSDFQGQLSFEGTIPVALLIAPGPALVAQAGTGCTAWTQSRPISGPPDLRNYLECENATFPADATFVASRAGQTFNDQVLPVMAADVIPALEAAVADRMQREIAPAIKAAAYTSTQYAGLPSGIPLYPYPVPFSDPTVSNYHRSGTSYPNSSNPQGLLPVNQINTACTAPPPCSTLAISHPTTIRSTLEGYVMSYSCSTSASEVLCEGQYHEHDPDPTENVRLEMAVTFSDVAMGFRALHSSPVSQMLAEARDDGTTGAWLTPSPSVVQIRMNDGSSTLPDGSTPPRGSVTIRFHVTMPNIDANFWDTYADFRMRINRAVFDDHPVVQKTDATLGWFVRNEWYRNIYYATALYHTADALPSLDCSTNSGASPSKSRCIRFNETGTYNIRALLVLAGLSLPTQPARPSSNPLAYFEVQNADDGTLYEHRLHRMSRVGITSPYWAPWNDRVILVDWNPGSPPNSTQVHSLTPLRVVTLP